MVFKAGHSQTEPKKDFMPENTGLDLAAIDFETEKKEIISDLLYTLFATLDEYTTLIHPNENLDGQLTRMSAYLDKEMREYAKALYNIELEPTDYDYMLQSKN